MCELACQIVQKKQEEKRIEEEQAAKARYWKIPACCDDDEDYDSAITPILSTKEPVDSISMGDEHLDKISATESDEVIKSSVEDLVPIPSEFEGIPDTMCDVHFVNNHTPLEAKDHVEIVINSNDDISSSDDDSLHEENIEYVEASPHDSELVSLEAAKIVIPGVEEIEDDNLHKKLLNVHLLIANIEALKDNPTPSSEILTKSSSTSLNSFLEETNTFHNSLPKFENFYCDLGEIGSGSTTTHSDISLPDYEAFYFDDDHIKEISSGSTTTHYEMKILSLTQASPSIIFIRVSLFHLIGEILTKSSSTSLNSFLEETNTFHNSLSEFENFYCDLGEISSGSSTTYSDISLPDYEAFSFNNNHIKEISSGSTTTHSDISLSEYDSFIFDFAHIISPPEYDRFYFRDLPDPGELMSALKSRIRENLLSTTSVNLPIEDDHSPLLAYVVWIFVAYLTIPGNLKTLAK
nr:hypothetical protein [Tanacetum cinerariifolium]